MQSRSLPPTNQKTAQVSLRMSPMAKALLRAAAAVEHRSAANMLEHLVFDYCEKNGITLDATAALDKKSAKGT